MSSEEPQAPLAGRFRFHFSRNIFELREMKSITLGVLVSKAVLPEPETGPVFLPPHEVPCCLRPVLPTSPLGKAPPCGDFRAEPAPQPSSQPHVLLYNPRSCVFFCNLRNYGPKIEFVRYTKPLSSLGSRVSLKGVLCLNQRKSDLFSACESWVVSR